MTGDENEIFTNFSNVSLLRPKSYKQSIYNLFGKDKKDIKIIEIKNPFTFENIKCF